MAPDHGTDPDDTVVRPPAYPAAAPSGPDLDETLVRGALPPLPASAPPGGASALEPAATGDSTAGAISSLLRLPDGRVVELSDGTVYLGRRPSLPRVPAAGVPQLVALPSPRREVSSTHLAISGVGGAVVVRDMLSTNGTVVKTPGVPARTLLRGESLVVTPGTTLDLGDGNLVEVLR